MKQFNYPPRSELFHLKPEGIGTPFVESMSSYVNRLAEEHRTPVGALIADVISKKLASEYCRQKTQFGRSYTPIGAQNGIGYIAEQWNGALSLLTMRKGLEHLSLLFYRNILTENKLLRKYKAWCPRCLHEMAYDNEGTIYEPLLWKIEAVKVCPRHLQPLETICPKCRRQPDHLSTHSRNGFCSRYSCKARWLGNNIDLSLDEKDVQAELRYTTEVGKLLELTGKLSSAPDRDFVAWYVSALVDNHTRGNISGFATLLKIPRENASHWKNGVNVPRLSKLLKMSIFFNDSLTDRLKEWDSLQAKGNIILSGTPIPSANIVRELKHQNLSSKSLKAEEMLKNIVNGIEAPIAIKSIARVCGCHPSLLYLHFKELCHRVTVMRKQSIKELQEIRHQRFLTSVSEAKSNYTSKGIYPSQKLLMNTVGIKSKRVIEEVCAS